jgi:serine/threonine-protein kinase
MSPEQATGGAIGPATDVYALGVVAFELATGRLPFDAESSVQLMAKHVDETPPKPSTLAAVSPGFERLILEMLDKHPTARPPAKEIRERIGTLRLEPTPEQQTGERTVVPSRQTAPTVAVRRSDPGLAVQKTVAAATTPETSPPARRRPVAVIAGAAVLVVGVVAFFVLRSHASAEDRQPPVAAEPAAQPAPPAASPTPPAPPPAVVVQPAEQAPAPAEHPPAPTEPAKPFVAKHPAHASHRPPPPPEPAQGSAQPAPQPPVVAAPAQGSATSPPAPPAVHDVDAVRDPFANGGGK